MTLPEALQDPQLFGRLPAFKSLESWRAWLVIIKALFGLSLEPQELELFKAHTGRTVPPAGACREAWIIAGRRSGKSFMAAVTAVYLACFRDYRPYLAAGERAVIMVVATDRRQARVVLGYIRGLLRAIPLLARMIESERAEEIDLNNSTTIAIYTADKATIRGPTVGAAVFDEVAFLRVDGVNPAAEILAAIRPSMATIPNSLRLCITSPYSREGLVYDTYTRHYGHDDSDVLVWQAPTRVMNPTLSAELIERERQLDPAAAVSEWDAEFRADVCTFLIHEWIDSAVDSNVHERAPVEGVSYCAAVDPSGGSQDAFTLAIAHQDAERGEVIVDVARAWHPPFSPKQVVSEIRDVLARYHAYSVTGDRYGAEWVSESFRDVGISYSPAPLTRSEAYLEFEPLLAQGTVRLPDNKTLLRELRQLERKTTRAGRDSVDHPRGCHDDVANAVALVAVEAHEVNDGPAFYTAPASMLRRRRRQRRGLSYEKVSRLEERLRAAVDKQRA